MEAQDFLGRPEACVVLIPKALQPNADRVSDRYTFAGPAIDESRKQGWTPPPGDEPLVYISFGTAYTDRADLYTQFATELAPDHRVVIATGKVDPDALPDTVTAARTMPQLDVLEHADVFITHAGMGGANEALWYGVPVVAAPQAVDQFANAATLEAIGWACSWGSRPHGRRSRGRAVCRPGAELRAATCGATAAWTRPPTPSNGLHGGEQRLGGQRPGEQVALPARAAQRAQRLPLGLGLDPLGHDGQPERTPEVHDRPRERPTARVQVSMNGFGILSVSSGSAWRYCSDE